MKELADIIESFHEFKAEKNILERKNKKLRSETEQAHIDLKDYIDTKALLNKTIEIVHQDFQSKTKHIITKIIKNIFNRDIDFRIVLEEKRNMVETQLIVSENGEDYDPKDDEVGGSIIDVISFMLKIITIVISSNPKRRRLLILDEPFKNMGRLSIKMVEALKEITSMTKNNFQIIMTTHDTKLLSISDRAWSVSHNGIMSKVIRRRV